MHRISMLNTANKSPTDSIRNFSRIIPFAVIAAILSSCQGYPQRNNFRERAALIETPLTQYPYYYNPYGNAISAPHIKSVPHPVKKLPWKWKHKNKGISHSAPQEEVFPAPFQWTRTVWPITFRNFANYYGIKDSGWLHRWNQHITKNPIPNGSVVRFIPHFKGELK